MHDLVFHGGGGFQYYDVYNMPIWLRRFHANKISEFNKEQNDSVPIRIKKIMKEDWN